MSGLLGAMLAEAQSSGGMLLFGLELDFTSGTWQISNGPISSTSRGHYDVLIRSFAELPRSYSDRRGGMVSSDFSVTIDDTHKRFANLLGTRERIRDVPARVRIFDGNLRVSPVLYWTGRLYDWTRNSDMSWRLNLRPNDVTLKQNFMRKTITPAAWPHAADDVRGAIAPIVIGAHDSSGMGSRNGALPTLNVKNDAAPFYRLASWGWLGAVPHVFEGDDLLTLTTDYTIEYLISAGQRWTVVSFTSDPTGEIRVDALGIDTVGDRTGSFLASPTDILKWLAVNLWYQENTSGLWFTNASDLVDTAALDGVKNSPEFLRGANGQPYKCSAYFNGEMTPDTYIQQWCQNYRVNLGYTVEGKLTAKLISNLDSGSYVSAPVFRHPHEVDGIEIAYPAEDWIRRIVVRYGTQQGSDYIGSEELLDPIVDVESSEVLELAAGPAFK